MNYSILHGLNQNETQCLYCDQDNYVELTIKLKAIERKHVCESRFCSLRKPTFVETKVRLCATCLNEKIPHDFLAFGELKNDNDNNSEVLYE